jgi:hypothetical protein
VLFGNSIESVWSMMKAPMFVFRHAAWIDGQTGHFDGCFSTFALISATARMANTDCTQMAFLGQVAASRQQTFQKPL